MIIEFEKKLKCSKEDNGYLVCSDSILDKLKIKFPNLKLRAENKTEKVHGFIHIFHAEKSDDHLIKIILYDVTGKDHNNANHPRALKYPETFPSKSQLMAAL